jgi:Ca-activated chloride channel homolog
MVRTFSVTVCVAAALAGGLAAQEPARVFKSSVAVVPISAVVRDGRGRPITTLKASDFVVRDNGEARPILAFDTDAATPLTIAVVVDTSGSMRLDSKRAAARQVVGALTAELREGVDAVGLFTFDATLHEVRSFTDHTASLDAALGDAVPFGVTSLYDAIAETARRLEARPSGRRAIVVLTDGVDTSSLLAPSDVSSRASAIDVPVYVVATVQKVDQIGYAERATSPASRSTADARDLARWTGGELLWATSAWDAASAARQILSELRHQYVMAVDSAVDGNWRRLDVRVRDPHMIVRARSGYFARDAHPER